jgi:hypothetical protein
MCRQQMRPRKTGKKEKRILRLLITLLARRQEYKDSCMHGRFAILFCSPRSHRHALLHGQLGRDRVRRR